MNIPPTTRPILFSTENVRKILSGEKTSTRRIMKRQPSDGWTPAHMTDIHKMVDGDFAMKNGEPIVIGWGAVNDFGDEGYVSPFGHGLRKW